MLPFTLLWNVQQTDLFASLFSHARARAHTHTHTHTSIIGPVAGQRVQRQVGADVARTYTRDTHAGITQLRTQTVAERLKSVLRGTVWKNYNSYTISTSALHQYIERFGFAVGLALGEPIVFAQFILHEVARA